MRIGLIGASIRPAAVALADTNRLAIGIDWFSDQETIEVLGSRSLVARDYKHAKALVMQFSKSPRIRKRRSSPGYSWVLAGGLDLQPQLLATLTWSGSQILGCGIKAIRSAKSIETWAPQLGKIYPYIPRFRVNGNPEPGVWHWKENWPESTYAGFWQQSVPGENRSALFLAKDGRAELVGVCRQYTTAADSAAGPYFYLGNEVLSVSDYDHAIESLLMIGQWFADQPEVAGLFGVDFIQNEHVWPIEINPRITASVEAISIATGRNLWLEHVESAQPEEAEAESPNADVGTRLSSLEDATLWVEHNVKHEIPPIKLAKSVVKRIFYNGESQRSIDDSFYENLTEIIQRIEREQYLSLQILDRPKPGAIIGSGEPICTILLTGKTTESKLWTKSQLIEDQLSQIAWLVQ